MFRHSCGKCHFTNLKRPSDITIADFWGWQKTDPNFNKDDKGVSLVFVNTERGQRLFNAVKKDLNVISARIDDCLQPNLQKPSDIHPQRIKFEEDYARKGFKYVYYKYGNEGWLYKLHKLPNRVKKVIKKLIGLR